MVNDATLILHDVSGERVEMLRRKNPDGSIGGLVASGVIVPKQTSVPFDSIIGPGVNLTDGQIVPERTILSRGGRVDPNTVTPVR